MVDEATFAIQSLRAYQLYHELSLREKDSAFQRVLEELAHTSKEQFDFWALKSNVRGDMARLPVVEIWFFRAMRLVCGLALTVRFVLRKKERTIAEYARYCRTCNPDSDVRTITAFVDRLHAITDDVTGSGVDVLH